MQKRGVSLIVSSAILLVILVSVAIITYTFLQTQTPKLEIDCPDGTELAIESASCDSSRLTITLLNSGRFNTEAAFIRMAKEGRDVRFQVNEGAESAITIPVGEPETFIFPLPSNIEDGANVVEVQPAITEDRNLYVCRGKAIARKLTCENIASTEIDCSLGTYIITSPGSYYLAKNYLALPWTCIEIRTDNVVIDGADFTISGDGTTPSIYGIYSQINNLYTNIVIKNINVKTFTTGISLAQIEDSRIENSEFSSNLVHGIHLRNDINNVVIKNNNIIYNTDTGIFFEFKADSITIEGNYLSHNAKGIRTGATATNDIIQGNEISYNVGRGLDIGVQSADPISDNIEISENNITHNNLEGIYVRDTQNSIIENNNISENNNAGVSLSSGTNNMKITKNTIAKNGNDGVFINTPNNEISENQITENSKSGIFVNINGNANIIILNNIITKQILQGVYITGNNNHISGNVINNQQRDGINFVSGTGNILSSNQVCDNHKAGSSYYDVNCQSSANINSDTGNNVLGTVRTNCKTWITSPANSCP